MDISRIIYKNEASGKINICSDGDYYNIESLRIYDNKYLPIEQLEKVIINRELIYLYSGKGLPGIIPELFSIREKLPERFHELRFKITELDNEKIIINVSEKIAIKRYAEIEPLYSSESLATIEFHKRNSIVLGGRTGDAAVIITNVQKPDGSLFCIDIEKESGFTNIERFALSIGLSLFVEMDGDWDKIIRNSKEQVLMASQKLKVAKQEISDLRIDNARKDNEINELHVQIESYRNELFETRKWAFDTLHLQDTDVDNFDIRNEKDWDLFTKRVIDIVNKMKDNDSKSDNGDKLINIRKTLKEKYRKFDKDNLNFLSTGQYLLELHKNDDIDFSPVLIAFSKCLEGVLAKLLIEKKIILKNDPTMLGNLLFYINTRSSSLNLYGFQLTTIMYLTNGLKEFIKYRNMAAHKEGIKYEQVVRAKKLLYDLEKRNRELLLDLICSRL